MLEFKKLIAKPCRSVAHPHPTHASLPSPFPHTLWSSRSSARSSDRAPLTSSSSSRL